MGPAVSDDVWLKVSHVVEAAGWRRVTVDAFASASKARVPHFWSRFHEQGSETIDAL